MESTGKTPSLEKIGEKSGSISSLSSASSDQNRRAAILRQQRGNIEDSAISEPPAALSTSNVSFFGLFSNENVSTEAANVPSVVEKATSRRSEISSAKSLKNRFDRAYEDYYSSKDGVGASAAESVFSRPIIAVEKSSKASLDVQRPEECKEYQRSSAIENSPGSRPGISYESERGAIRFDDIAFAMPGATFSSADTGPISKLAANVNLSASPQRSSSSSTSDTGTSAFMEMAKRLHRLRIAAVAPNPNLLPKMETRTKEFISIQTLAGKIASNVTVEKDSTVLPPIASIRRDNANDQISSQPGSAAASFSDISVASFYRLPPAQEQTSRSIRSRRPASASTLERSRVWSSEPRLLDSSARSGAGGAFSKLDFGGQEQASKNRPGASQLETGPSSQFSRHLDSGKYGATSEDLPRGAQIPRTNSWSQPGSKLPEDGQRTSTFARPQQSARDFTPAASSLPPIHANVTNVGGAAGLNAEVDERSIPGSFSKLLDAVTNHPTGSLDISKLKNILREQRKLYKRRLEKEKAKRQALEELLVKLNSTPRHRSHSNSSSSKSTVRDARGRAGENGRSSAELNDVVINSLRSSSFDDSSTSSADFLLLELIQQHLRMKQSLIGHLGRLNATVAASSTAEDENGDAPANGVDNSKLATRFPHALDDDEIPMGGEASTGPTAANGNYVNGDQPMDSNHKNGTTNGRRIDKDALKLLLDNNSSANGSESGRRSSSERRQRRKWETSGKTDAAANPSFFPNSSIRRSSVAYFVPAGFQPEAEIRNGFVELKETKPLQNAFLEGKSKFMERSQIRQDKIKAASSLRAETARRLRELAENIAQGHMRMEDVNADLLVYELPRPSAFPIWEMVRASKIKYEQLPEIVARRQKLKTEAELATNRVMGKMFKQKLAYNRLLKKIQRRDSKTSRSQSSTFTNRSNQRLLKS